jgi:hypothetical protein
MVLFLVSVNLPSFPQPEKEFCVNTASKNGYFSLQMGQLSGVFFVLGLATGPAKKANEICTHS